MKIMTPLVRNILWYQAIWFLAILLGDAAVTPIFMLLTWHIASSPDRSAEIVVMIGCGALGSGTVRAASIPLVFLTSNNTRDVSDALKRRCLHLHIPFPDVDLEERIVASRVPDVEDSLRHQLVSFVHAIRELDLRKQPAVSETIDWARSLLLLHARELDRELVDGTLNVLLKFEQDVETATAELPTLLRDATRGDRGGG